METDVLQNPKEHVFQDIINGVTAIDTEVDPAEQRLRIFNFIAVESKGAIAAQVTKLVANLGQGEKRYYEQRVAELEEKVKEAQTSGADSVSFDDLMIKVGLSPRLKVRNVVTSVKPFEAQSFK